MKVEVEAIQDLRFPIPVIHSHIKARSWLDHEFQQADECPVVKSIAQSVHEKVLWVIFVIFAAIQLELWDQLVCGHLQLNICRIRARLKSSA